MYFPQCCPDTIGGVPKKIATYLLQEPELYTGHSFRRSAATMVLDAGGDILTLKRAGGWKSSGIAEGYVDDSINNESFKGPRVPKKHKLHKNELNTTFFCSTSPPKGSKWLKIFKISLTFRFDKLSNSSKSVHTGENSQILTVSNKKKCFLDETQQMWLPLRQMWLPLREVLQLIVQ
jgi:hypothetical protein